MPRLLVVRVPSGSPRPASLRWSCSPRLPLVREPSGSTRSAPLSHARPCGWTGAASSSSALLSRARSTWEAGAGSSLAHDVAPSPWASSKGRVRATRSSRVGRGLPRRLFLLLPRRRSVLLLVETERPAPREGCEARLIPCRWYCSPALLLSREPSGSSRAVPMSRPCLLEWTGAISSSSARLSHSRPTGEAGAALPPASGGTTSLGVVSPAASLGLRPRAERDRVARPRSAPAAAMARAWRGSGCHDKRQLAP